MKKSLFAVLLLLGFSTMAFGRPAVVFGPQGALVVTKKLCFQDDTCQETANVAGGVGSVSGTAPIVSSGGSSPVISCIVATGSVAGCLSAADWTTFNGKVSATRNINTATPLGGGGNLSADRTLTCDVASGSQPGCLSSADWTTFNGKQASGSYITALTGEGSATGPGSATFTLGSTIAGATTFSTSLTSPIFKSSTANPASAGAVRLATSDTIQIRSQDNLFNNSISVTNLGDVGLDVFKFSSASGDDAGVVMAGNVTTTGGQFLAGQFFGTNQLDVTEIDVGSGDSTFQSITTASGTDSPFAALHIEASSAGPVQNFAKARGTSTSLAIVNSNDELGEFVAFGYDGADFQSAAKIGFEVGGTPGTADMPGAIRFMTTPDGSTTLTTALVIQQNQNSNFVGRLTSSKNGAASNPGFQTIGTWFTGGSATTTKPQVYIEPSGTTSNNWSTSGTGIGANAASGFTGNLIDAQVAAVRKFNVTGGGQVVAGSALPPAPTVWGGLTLTPKYMASSSSGADTAFAAVTNADTDSSAIALFRSKGSNTSPSAVVSGNSLGEIWAMGYDGTDYAMGAAISFAVDGTPGSDDMPAGIFLQTSADGTDGPINAFSVDSIQRSTLFGHERSQQSATTTATVNANAGTGATCTLSNATDMAGTINLTTTVVAPAAGEQCKVNFSTAYGVAPICVFSPADADASNFAVIQGVYGTSSTTIFSINFATAELTGRTYNWTYRCTETQ